MYMAAYDWRLSFQNTEVFYFHNTFSDNYISNNGITYVEHLTFSQ